MITSPRVQPTHRKVIGVDLVLIAASLAVATVGVVMVYSATRGALLAAGESPTSYLKRQALWVVLGVVAMAVMALIDYRRLESVAMLIYAGSVLTLLVVLVPHIGSRATGSQRWFALGPLQLQPSEFAVLALIAAVATYCSRRNEGLAWARRGPTAGDGRDPHPARSWSSRTWAPP